MGSQRTDTRETRSLSQNNTNIYQCNTQQYLCSYSKPHDHNLQKRSKFSQTSVLKTLNYMVQVSHSHASTSQNQFSEEKQLKRNVCEDPCFQNHSGKSVWHGGEKEYLWESMTSRTIVARAYSIGGCSPHGSWGAAKGHWPFISLPVFTSVNAHGSDDVRRLEASWAMVGT